MFEKFFKNENPKHSEESKENLINQYIDSKEVQDTNEDTYYNFRDLKLDFMYGDGKRRIMHRPFGKIKRKIIFILLFFINILINIDHGAIPAATTILKRDLSIDNVSLGIIGSLVYLGLVLGAISASVIFQSYSSKWVVIIGLILSCLFLYIFTVVKSVFMLAVSRIGCGFFQVF
jgi:fucose permease